MQRAVTSGLDAVEPGGITAKLRDLFWGLWPFVRERTGDTAEQRCLESENRRLRDELCQLRAVVEQTGRLSAMGTLAASIAHEIRNPLVSVRTFFQLAPQRWNDAEFAGSFRELTESEVVRISDLVTELLGIAKPPARSMADVDLDDLVQRMATLLAPQARRQRVHLEWEGLRAGAAVHGSEDLLKQVFLNLILNAIEATPERGTVSVSTRKAEGQSGRCVQVEVCDTGPGIPAEIRECLFEPFHTTKANGTGLGLSIAHRVVAEHDGFISVESSTGEGTRLLVQLPVSGANGNSSVGTGVDASRSQG